MSVANHQPDFGASVPDLDSPCSPRDLFCRLLKVEENVHYLKPAFRFASAALDGAQEAAPPLTAPDVASHCSALIDRARTELNAPVPADHATSWPGRVAREFAPVGLTDGVWLQGLVRVNVVENETGMACLKQLMSRFGDPGTGESYSQRYGALLRSSGVPPASITRWEREDEAPCADISYEHGLLGLCLGLFPSALGLEALGFNLWMAALGPCPLLTRLEPALKQQNLCVRYFDQHDRQAHLTLAREAVVHGLEGDDGGRGRARVSRGFFAAHESYRRWESAMLGRNVPMTPRDFVLDMVKRKAPFAMGHHAGISLGGVMLEDMFRGKGGGPEALLSHLAESHLVLSGDPQNSSFLSRSISIEGPMFDVFTATEQRDLREWIARLPDPPAPAAAVAAVPLAGRYTPPQDPEALQQHALHTYGGRSLNELLYLCANCDQFPAVRIFARKAIEVTLAKLEAAFSKDARLSLNRCPEWSELAISQMVAERHARNVSSRQAVKPAAPADPPATNKPSIGIAFDGSWLQGFADVYRSELEEYGWLFRIYASEQGDGNLPWNHNFIARMAAAGMGQSSQLPATDRRLYDFCTVDHSNLLPLAASLNTQHFLPELLGANLGIEATGVGGSYLDAWRRNLEPQGNRWLMLSFRLHNSIDNYATGHTRWSLAAIQAYMARVSSSAPVAVQTQWQRIWRLWRVQEIIEHGSEDERSALSDALGFKVKSLAPTAA